ncbi:MAG: DUF3822 family protein [Bacteroidia bacterium]
MNSSNYQNAVSDKLIVLNQNEQVSVLVSSKNSEPKYYKAFISSEGEHEVKSVLSTSIFESTTVIDVNPDFVLCPIGLSQEEQGKHFQLSYEKSGELLSQPLSQEIDIVYPRQELPFDLASFLVNPISRVDIQLLHEYKSGLQTKNAVYISSIDQQLLIRIYSGQNLLLCNRFDTQNLEEIRYFVLFAVEELNLDISALHFEFLGSQKEYEPLKELFNPHLPMLLKLPGKSFDQFDLSSQTIDELADRWFTSICLECV